MKFAYRIFRQGAEVLLAISDSAILGKTFEEGELAITVSEDFYAGKTCGEKEAIRLIKGATIVNAVGDGIVSLMLRQKLIERDTVLTINGTPHAQVIKV